MAVTTSNLPVALPRRTPVLPTSKPLRPAPPPRRRALESGKGKTAQPSWSGGALSSVVCAVSRKKVFRGRKWPLGLRALLALAVQSSLGACQADMTRSYARSMGATADAWSHGPGEDGAVTFVGRAEKIATER